MLFQLIFVAKTERNRRDRLRRGQPGRGQDGAEEARQAGAHLRRQRLGRDHPRFRQKARRFVCFPKKLYFCEFN